MAFINFTNSIGGVVLGATSQVTGQIELTILILMFVIILLALLFRIPLEYTAILILPLTLGTMAYYQEFLKIGGLLLFYLSFIFVKNLIFNR